jgi:hypothetical protein
MAAQIGAGFTFGYIIPQEEGESIAGDRCVAVQQ